MELQLSSDSPAQVSPARRDWVDVTIRLATSWVGLFTAYVVALILALTKFKELARNLNDVGIPPWVGIVLIVALPLLAFLFSTIPTFLDQRRIKHYAELTGTLQTGYFTLRPRESEEGFQRADNAHNELLRWIEHTKEPVLYLTGASGTGKSSLLSAWVIPKLQGEKHVVIQLRGYEGDLLARLREKVLDPRVVWDKPPGKNDDLRSLLNRATHHLGERRLIIVIDQFEEFLILANQEQQGSFQQFLSEERIGGVTFLLVFRTEYEGVIQDQLWPQLQLGTNRKVISPFTERAAQEFIGKSGLSVDTRLMRKVLREAAEIEQTAGLIRPVTINLCDLVLGRFSSGLPSRFRGSLVRGFLRESLSLPEVRDVAGKLIPELISDNVTKRPRSIADLMQATALATPDVRACLRRLGESDRAIVRPLDLQQETWEISHDFLVPLLDTIVARRTVSLWRRFRPWFPWAATAIMGIAAILIPFTSHDPRTILMKQGWTLSDREGILAVFRYDGPIPPESIPILCDLPPPLALGLAGNKFTDLSALLKVTNLTNLELEATQVTDISALREMNNLTVLNLRGTQVTDISALRKMKDLTVLSLSGLNVTDISVLNEMKNLKELYLDHTQVTDVSPLRAIKNLTQLDVSGTKVRDLSPLRGMESLTRLDLSGTKVDDISPLREMENLTDLNLDYTQVTDLSPLLKMKSLTQLRLNGTRVTNVTALGEIRNLTLLDLGGTKVPDASPLREMKNLTTLSLSSTDVKDVSPLGQMKNLTRLDLSGTKVKDLSPLRQLDGLTQLDLSATKVNDLSPLRELENLTDLNIDFTQVTDVSPLMEMGNLIILQLTGAKVTNVSALRELRHLRIVR